MSGEVTCLNNESRHNTVKMVALETKRYAPRETCTLFSCTQCSEILSCFGDLRQVGLCLRLTMIRNADKSDLISVQFKYQATDKDSLD